MKKNIRYISIVSGLALAMSTSALAKTIIVYEEPTLSNDSSTKVKAVFQANQENANLGRAWIDVTSDRRYLESEWQHDQKTDTRKIPGLSYDASSGQIVYQEAGKTAVPCAIVSRKQFLFLKNEKVEPTGKCELTVAIEKKSFDDGLRVSDRLYSKVTMDIRE